MLPINLQKRCIGTIARERCPVACYSNVFKVSYRDLSKSEHTSLLLFLYFPRNFTKKSRLSIGGKRFDKKNQQQPHNATPLPAIVDDPLANHPVMERRWSVVGAGWPRKKPASANTSYVRKSMTSACADLSLSPPSTLSTPPIPCSSSESVTASSDSLFSSDYLKDLKIDGGDNESDFMRISKSEYEAIKDRVTAIESRISKEFQTIQETRSNMDNSFLDLNVSIPTADRGNVVDRVMDKYEKTLDMQQITSPNSPSTDLLAKRLSRELKIRRRSSDQPIIRSPSARKIGTMQRRSRENVRVSRNFSWHMTPNVEPTVDARPIVIETPIEPMVGVLHPMIKASLKRGRPNTLQTGLRHPSPTKKPLADCDDEQWTSAEQFFAGQQTPVKSNLENREPLVATTPFFVSTASMNEMKTPMLPPRRPVNHRTPLTINHANHRTPMLPPRSTPVKPTSAIINKALLLTPVEDTITGRASIARLRSQNAGMVAAKAKLFNGFVTETADPPPPSSSAPSQEALPRESTIFAFEHFAAHRIAQPKEPHRFKLAAPRPSFHGHINNNSPRKSMTPRRGNKNLNGIHRRQKLRLAKSPINKGSPMRLRHLLLDEATNRHAMSLVKDVTKHSSPRGKHPAVNRTTGFQAAMQSIVNESPAGTPSVPVTPHIKPSLGHNSPRRLAKTPSVPPHRSTPIKLRHSPAALTLLRQCGTD